MIIDRLAVQDLVTRALIAGGEWSEVATEVLASIGRFMGWPLGALYESDDAANLSAPVAVWRSCDGPPASEELMLCAGFETIRGFADELSRHSRPVWRCAPLGSDTKVKGACLLPLTLDGELCGALQFVSVDDRRPDAEFERAWESLGPTIGLGVRRARAERARRDVERDSRERLERELADHQSRLRAAAEDRERLARELRAGQTRLQRLFESDVIGIIVSDYAGHVKEANDQFLRMIGCTREELEDGAIDWRGMTPPEYLPLDDAAVAELQRKGAAEPWAKEFVRRDGTRVAVVLGAALLEGTTGETICFVLDDTERRRAENALRASEAKLRRLFESDVIGIFVGEMNGRVVEANDAFLDLVGYTRDDLGAGRLWRANIAAFDSPAERDSRLPRLLADGRLPGQVMDLAHKTGRRVPVVLGGALLDDRQRMIAFVLDISLRRNAEDALARINRELEERVRERTASLQQSEERVARAVVALSASESEMRSLAAHLQSVREDERTELAREIHDVLGQELTGLKMDAGWVMRRLSDGAVPHDAVQERLSMMQRQIEGAITTVRRIATSLRPSILDDLGLVAALEWQARDFARRSGLTVAFRATRDEVGLERPAATAIFRVFQELLTNVARHARARTVDVRLVSEPDRVVLEVQDDGRGITDVERLGAGSLGLVGIRERLAAVGGEWQLTGRPGSGTVARVSVPLCGRRSP